MTALPDLEPCAQCDHKRGEHASTAGGSFNVRPVQYGRCRVTGCDCAQYEPKPSSDQSESVARRIEGVASRVSLADDPAELEGIVNDLLAIAQDVRRVASDEGEA